MRKATDDEFKNRHVKLSMAVAAKAPVPPNGEYIAWDTQNVTLGFGLRVYASGAKRWIMQRKIGRKPVKVTLGQFPGMTMTEALKLAAANLAQFVEKINPNVASRVRRIDLAVLHTDASLPHPMTALSEPFGEMKRPLGSSAGMN